ncbi:hypothetical protein EBR57_00340 [bacterium]|nr:hypothetical protein [bacterium]
MAKNQTSSATPSLQTDSSLDHLIESLPNDPLLRQFALCYLHANSTRTLQGYEASSFEEFISTRYRYFVDSLAKGGDIRIFTLDQSNELVGIRRVLEYVVPDAMFMVMTFSEVFKEFGCKITKMLHPIMTVTLDNTNQIQQISPPTENTFLVSVTYIEFEGIEDDSQIDAFFTRIQHHMSALQNAQGSQKVIRQKLSDIKTDVAQTKVILAEPKEEWVNLIDWLQDDNFSFFGYALLNFKNPDSPLSDGSGILSPGYLNEHPQIGSVLSAHSWRMRTSRAPFVFDTIPINSPIQRFEHIMRLSFRIVVGDTTLEHNFIGVLKRSSLLAKNLETPIIHLKMKHIFEAKRMLPGSYDYNEVIRIFTSIPKFELFRSATDDLLFIVESVLSITNPSDVYCFHRETTGVGRTLLMVTLPEHLFTRTNIELISDYLIQHVPHAQFEVVEVDGPDHNRLHFYFEQTDDTQWKPNESHLQIELRELVKPWEDRLKDAIQTQFPGQSAQRLYAHYINAFPSHHRVRRTPVETVRDIMFLEKVVHENIIQFDLSPVTTENSSLKGRASMLSIYNRNKIDLIHIMPILQNLGVYVFDELTTRVGTTDTLYGYIHSFRLGHSDKAKIDEKRLKAVFTSLLTEIFEGRTENDRLNGLALGAELDWRAINVLQTYRNLYLQLGTPHSKDKVNSVLLAHKASTKALFKYFETKFSVDPQFGKQEYRQEVLLPRVTQEFHETLTLVHEVSDDTIFRHLFNLIEATLRTNFYIPKHNRDTFISIKLDSKQVRFMPAPSPYREIYVHDVGMEGTHLRFGPIARGGLRWSDRHDDFRKEVLGLVKTQQTKNVVIVPVGSKGGFIIKRAVTKEEAANESIIQYRKFISALLDITDNIDANGSIKHPHHVMAYDQTDPYLVVAADKGTASFSDIANEISEKYEFWLGDAFASGGSIGYNHKKEAITARGGWECVKLHFMEMGKNIEKESFSAVGIGDMSGDVFGNGMLLSKTMKLHAAFNHVHIFVDPTPNPERSWEERKRLFDLPRSAWTDYSPTLISQGGGVYDRKAKEIMVTSEMRDLFGIKEPVVTGEELIRFILKAKVDLVWLGGIGTYFKASHQANSAVGDPTNDSVRIDITECRAAVIGEGANLGVTQPARIEFALSGGRINTDAIDNSAGVNMSDYEVNIKILLKQMLEESILKNMDERNELLEAATNEVSELVLANNQGQHRLLSMDSIRSKKQLGIFIKLIQSYTASGFLDAKTEQIPDLSELEQWASSGISLPRPILAVIQAYTKMNIYDRLMNSDILDAPYFTEFYDEYFPVTIRKKIGKEMPKHRLQRNILGTILTNKIINQAGILFFFQMEQLTGKPVDQIAKAYYLLDCALGTQELRQAIIQESIPEQDKYSALIEIEHYLVEWTQSLLLLPNFDPSFDWAKPMASLASDIVPKAPHNKAAIARWKHRGLPETSAKQLVGLDSLNCITDILFLQLKFGIKGISQIVDLIDTIESKFELKWVESAIQNLDPKTQWELSHKGILLQTVKIQKFTIIRQVMGKETSKKGQVDEAINALQRLHQMDFKLYFETLSDLKSSRNTNLTTLTVAVNRLNFLNA